MSLDRGWKSHSVLSDAIDSERKSLFGVFFYIRKPRSPLGEPLIPVPRPSGHHTSLTVHLSSTSLTVFFFNPDLYTVDLL